MFDLIHSAEQSDLDSQVGVIDPCATFPAEAPLTPMQAYALFILQYRRSPCRWLVLRHWQLRTIRTRQEAVRKYVLPVAMLQPDVLEKAARILLTAFALSPPEVKIGQPEF